MWHCWGGKKASQTWQMWPAQHVFVSSSLWIQKSLQIISNFIFTVKVDVGAQQAQSNYSPPHLPPPRLYAEWAVLHNTAPIIHQAAKKTIYIHQFSPRELWSRWYKRLYGSDHISHSGLINRWMQSQMLLAGLHMFQLPPRGQKEIIIASNTVRNICICTCFIRFYRSPWVHINTNKCSFHF